MVTEIRKHLDKANDIVELWEMLGLTNAPEVSYNEAAQYCGGQLPDGRDCLYLVEDAVINNREGVGVAIKGMLPDMVKLLSLTNRIWGDIDFNGAPDANQASAFLVELKERITHFVNSVLRLCQSHGIGVPGIEELLYGMPDMVELEIAAESQQCAIPKELNTDEVKRIFDKAVDAGVLNVDFSGYHWNGTAPQLALFAEMVSEKLELANKWKPFEILFNKKNLAQVRYTSVERIGKVKGGDIIESIFK